MQLNRSKDQETVRRGEMSTNGSTEMQHAVTQNLDKTSPENKDSFSCNPEHLKRIGSPNTEEPSSKRISQHIVKQDDEGVLCNRTSTSNTPLYTKVTFQHKFCVESFCVDPSSDRPMKINWCFPIKIDIQDILQHSEIRCGSFSDGETPTTVVTVKLNQDHLNLFQQKIIQMDSNFCLPNINNMNNNLSQKWRYLVQYRNTDLKCHDRKNQHAVALVFMDNFAYVAFYAEKPIFREKNKDSGSKHCEERLVDQINTYLKDNSEKLENKRVDIFIYTYNSPCLKRERTSFLCCFYLILKKAFEWHKKYNVFTQVGFTKYWGPVTPNIFKDLTWSDISKICTLPPLDWSDFIVTWNNLETKTKEAEVHLQNIKEWTKDFQKQTEEMKCHIQKVSQSLNGLECCINQQQKDIQIDEFKIFQKELTWKEIKIAGDMLKKRTKKIKSLLYSMSKKIENLNTHFKKCAEYFDPKAENQISDSKILYEEAKNMIATGLATDNLFKDLETLKQKIENFSKRVEKKMFPSATSQANRVITHILLTLNQFILGENSCLQLCFIPEEHPEEHYKLTSSVLKRGPNFELVTV
ncbi:uncharacterized protein LOC114442662 [Parambassis ranga]|uniref:Uncharacterized protein LOC114442662 n=1 Tax=Parambassis ranga TaxID=210632 RepID=A0A6P7J6I7_9TELE|nr:uncharacterized protein LOC114442662 [Parambassis ranga]